VRKPATSDAATNAILNKLGARSVRPLVPTPAAAPLSGAARSWPGSGSLDLSRLVVVDAGSADATAAATALRQTPGVAFAEPDRYVTSMATAPIPVPRSLAIAPPVPAPSTSDGTEKVALPGNYGLTTSLQSYLNAGGVNAVGAYELLGSRYGQLPGTGEIITNVSIGDLTDQSTVVADGQRYLDLPSMPLIPTYTASPDGTLDPAGSTQNQDPSLGEVMLDFGVMAPLPHDQQRATAQGSGLTDLLGIAPGAKYRLVVPQQPTFDQIATALVAAANQNPRPNVITASLGFGTDSAGFPGRYLEDDPVIRATIAGIVRAYGIVVCVSANDGTRLYTPTAVGPDGGSTPTDLTANAAHATSVEDDAYSTTPSLVPDSGAIAAGGTTLDDTLAVSPRSEAAPSRTGTLAETRISGAGTFSSGFGTRVDLSAPSDGIVVFEHTSGGAAQAVTPVISGGTSASAPEIAAAAAVVLQAARLTGRSFTPAKVRSLLERTGRAVSTPPQIDRRLQVGPQIDVAAAVRSLLPAEEKPLNVRVSVAHRVTIGGLGGSFLEQSDPNRLDLAGATNTGEGLAGPVTFGIDLVGGEAQTHGQDNVGMPEVRAADYVLRVGNSEFHSSTPSIRVLPTDLLVAAGLPVVATADRQLTYTLQVRKGARVLASTQRTLAVGPSDGTFVEAPAPVTPATVPTGAPVTVRYDLTGVRSLTKPQLVVSTVGHWNPVLAPLFTAGYTLDLTDLTGTVTIPASAFHGGDGLYGIGIVQNSAAPRAIYGEFTPIRVGGDRANSRPDAPTLSAGGGFGHNATVTRAAPGFSVRYDVDPVARATGAMLEISAPAPTRWNSYNTFTNANGSGRDQDGVNAGSVAYKQLPRRSGTVSLDALALGLPTSMAYNVRVLPTDRSGNVVGQASPSSQLVVNDGLVPGGGTVDSFGIASADSVAAVHDATGSSVLPYAPATGTYQASIAHDNDPASRYEVIGVDAGAHRALVLHYTSSSTTQQLQTYDTGTGRVVSTSTVEGTQYEILGGRVDPVRHRGALLARHQPDRADTVLPVDLGTGTLGTPIPADAPGVSAGKYNAIDIDPATGSVYLAHLGGSWICFTSAAANVAAVDLDTRTVTPSGFLSNCAYGFASDGNGGQVYQLSYRSFSVNILGTTSLAPISASTLLPGTGFAVRQQVGLTLAVDGANHTALVPFSTPTPKAVFGAVGGLLTDSNSTGQMQVMDTTTGTPTETVIGFNFQSGFGGSFNTSTERSVQLDPATRTGWTYAPEAGQIEQFSY
jgi:hypothetical protein